MKSYRAFLDIRFESSIHSHYLQIVRLIRGILIEELLMVNPTNFYSFFIFFHFAWGKIKMSKGIWTRHFSEEGKTFYYNASKNMSLWQPPPDSIVHEAANWQQSHVYQQPKNPVPQSTAVGTATYGSSYSTESR